MFEVAQEDGTPLLWGWLQSKHVKGKVRPLSKDIWDEGACLQSTGAITSAFLYFPKSQMLQELQVKLAHLNVFTADEVMELDGGFDQAFQGWRRV